MIVFVFIGNADTETCKLMLHIHTYLGTYRSHAPPQKEIWRGNLAYPRLGNCYS
jgi:hypothetical protein